jgi:hypothetical protein
MWGVAPSCWNQTLCTSTGFLPKAGINLVYSGKR